MGLFDFLKKKPQKPEIIGEIYEFPYFGEVNVNDLEESYKSHFEIHNKYVKLELNFEKKSIKKSQIDKIERFMDDVKVFDKNNKYHLENRFDRERGVAFDYINYYFQKFDDYELSQIIDLEDKSTPKDLQLLQKLQLIKIRLYPDSNYVTEYFAAFDYSIIINGRYFNQFLVVYTDPYGKVEDIAWRS